MVDYKLTPSHVLYTYTHADDTTCIVADNPVNKSQNATDSNGKQLTC